MVINFWDWVFLISPNFKTEKTKVFVPTNFLPTLYNYFKRFFYSYFESKPYLAG